MSSLWWLQQGWKNARCSVCGVNIWDAGGDPDHGVCPEHFYTQSTPNEMPNQTREDSPLCDICGKNEACAGANGYGVCSEKCRDAAMLKSSSLIREVEQGKDGG